jgi:anti-sigma-K factor RskA
MPPHPSTPPERLFELLADRAVQGLPLHEEAELADLLRQWPSVDPSGLDRAATAANLAFVAPAIEELPAALVECIEAAGRAALAGPITPARVAHRPARWRPLVTWSGWMVAAACLVVAVGPWVVERVEPHPAIPVTWQSSIPNVTGDLLWDTRRHEGVLHVTGLPVNDPEQKQYQIWIIGPQGDDPPVDGGVFDVPSAAEEVTVYFRPPRPVPGARAFAITLEKKGGVPVSHQPRLAVATLEK